MRRITSTPKTSKTLTPNFTEISEIIKLPNFNIRKPINKKSHL